MENSWEQMWAAGLPRGAAFDCAGPSPVLKELLKLKPESTGSKRSKRSKRALVPGAGRAYDAVLLASKGYHTFAIDISKTAIAEANKVVNESNVAQNMIELQQVDFFSFEVPEIDRFDLIWDATFLCALPLALREVWAGKYVKLLKRESGSLVTLIFPIKKVPNLDQGPPFHLDVPSVRNLLEPLGFEAVSVQDPLPREHWHIPGSMQNSTAPPASALIVWRLKK